MIDCVDWPSDQRLPFASDEVSTTLLPSQKVVVLPAVITGAAGIGFTVTATGTDAGELQPFPSV